MIDAHVRQGSTVSRDGTPITYYVIGDGPACWVMPPAMGAPLVSMKAILEGLQHDLTIVTWDMRGFHRSGIPIDPAAYAMAHHVDDLAAVCEATGVERYVLGGWSMAVQVSLEHLHRRGQDDVLALVFINGPYEHVLDRIMPLPGLTAVALRALASGPRLAPALNPLSQRTIGRPGFARVLKRMGLLAVEQPFFDDVLRTFSTIDWGRYLLVMKELHAHSAAHLLPHIVRPTLVTAGGRDRMTPVAVGQHMHREIAGAELFVIPEATHYVVAEYPELLVGRIRRFLTEVGVVTAPAPR